ncbi:MAG: helix-turn-helix domain-containing protein [Clostridia bacterium]|nr:helix-turn-helix domain-containing protein [Clostridia bacterium]
MNNRFIDKNIIGPPPVGKLHYSSYVKVSPTPNQEASFNWLNIDFPYWHTHDHWEFYVVTYGSFTHSINYQEYTMQTGDACLIRPSDVHKLSYPNNKSKGHHLAFLFTEEYAKKLFSTLDEKTINEITSGKLLNFTTKNFPIAKIIESTLSLSRADITVEEKNQKTKIIIDALFSDFLMQRYVRTSVFPKWLSDFLLVLNDPTVKASTTELAKSTPYSYSRLSRVFKEYMETSIVDYIKHVKYKHACHLLTNTDMTILEISNELYYDSISYFNKLFKSFSNMTPTEYRKKTKAPPDNFLAK